MSYFSLLIYPIIIITALFGAQFYKKDSYYDGYLSITEVKAIQGLAAVCIVCHHMAQQTCASWLESGNIVHGLDLFTRTGFLYNAVFFFCSGFGLYKSLKTKKAYLRGYFRKRILPVWVPYVIVCFLFTFVRLTILNERMSVIYKITNFTGITIGYYFGWYVQAIIVFYLLFYFAYKKGASDFDSMSIIFGGVILWNIVGLFLDHNAWFLRGEWWYNATLLFPLGILYATKEEIIVDIFKKQYSKCLSVAVVSFIVFMSLAVYMVNTKGYYGENMGINFYRKMSFRLLTYVPEVLAATTFVWLLILICMKVQFKNRVLEFLGTHTLEIYLTHGFFLETIAILYNWRKESVFYGRPALLLLATFAGTIPSAIILKKVSERIVALINNKKGK